MADANLQSFDKRLRRIDKRHKKLAKGYVHTIGHDGLIMSTPRRRVERRFPLRGLLLVAIGVFAFKGFLYAQLGGATYTQRVDKLAAGTPVEQIGAYMMQAEPATLWVAGHLNKILP